MGIFKSMFAAPQEPLSIAMRDTLFGDMPIDRWIGNGSESQPFPWSAFVSARAHLAKGDRDAAVNQWRAVVDRPGLEPRQYLQAWHFLRQNGYQPPADIAKHVLGVVVEVGMAKGLDLVAAYPDHSARYYNYSGKAIVWEHPNGSLDGKIDELFAAANRVVAQIGPWNSARPPAPPTDHVRLCFLTPSGLHFGQAHMDGMAKDPIGAPVFYLAGGLMNAMIDHALAASAA